MGVYSIYDKLVYALPTSSSKAWLKVKGGMEVLLLNEKGLKNLLTSEIYHDLYANKNEKENIYRNYISRKYKSP